MALVVADRVQETTTTTGTGTYTLAGAKDGFQSFGAVGDGNTTYYACTDGTDYEVGIGTYTATGTTLARTTIIESSNSDLAVSWGAGSKDIFVTSPADKTLLVGRNLYADNPSSPTAPSATGTNAVAIGSGAISAGSNSAALGNSRAGAASSIAGAINNNSSSYGTTGVNTVSFGTQSRATNNSAVSIGQSSIASGYQSAAYGYNAVASGQDSFAGGSTTDATATNSTALGKNAQATHANATAVGYNAATSATNQVALGASGYAVRISSAYTLPTSDGTNGQVLTTDGAGAVTFADAGGGASAYTIDNKTAAYTVVSGDLGKIINCTSGTFTITLTAAATLGSGFSVYIWNTGTGAITIDPNASETIDGATTYILRQNEGTEVVCDGSNFSTGAKKTMRGYAENLPSTYGKPVASGAGAIALGNRNGDAVYLSQAQGTRSFAVNGYATANYSAAIGQNSGGGGAEAGGAGAMALGGSYASGTDSFAAAIATNSTSYGATGAYGIAIGRQAKASAVQAVCIGRNSDASQIYASVLGGYANAASATFSVVAGGSSNSAMGTYSFVTGNVNAARGPYSSIIGGQSNDIQTAASYAIASGSYANATIIGQKVHASGRFSGDGDAQGSTFILRADTTDATATVLTANNSSASTDNQIVADSDTCIMFSGTIVAMQNGAQDQGGWEIKGLLKNDGGTTTLVSSNIQTFADGNGWTVALSADNTNNALAITCTGEAAHNIRWVANISTSEVTYA